MEPEGSSPHSQAHATYPYPEPDQSTLLKTLTSHFQTDIMPRYIYEDSFRTSQRTQFIFIDRYIGRDCLRNKTGNVGINVTLRGVRKTLLAMEKQ
jgi:hypothetical protein